MELFKIDQRTCLQDGICAEVCPSKIIFFQKGGYPRPLAGLESQCIKCGHCVAACPSGSFSHKNIDIEQCPPVQRELQLSPEHCEHFLRSRRSIRVYKEKSVEKSKINRLIEIGRYAPSGRNSQDTEWLVLANRDEIKRIAGLVIDWMHWMLDNNEEEAISMHLEKVIGRWNDGMDIVFRGAPVVIVGHAAMDNHRAQTSCTLALSYLELAAASLGLGCCWAGYFSRAAAAFLPLVDALALPGDHRSFAGMMLGYPRYKYHRLVMRNSPAITWRF